MSTNSVFCALKIQLILKLMINSNKLRKIVTFIIKLRLEFKKILFIK
jgi:hypothetical protein